jgi:hypothetical protein
VARKGGSPEGQSFDLGTGSFNSLFDFDDPPQLERLILDPVTGAILAGGTFFPDPF